MAEQQSFLSSWQERLTALRNTPPVLKIVWKSGPGVVVFGLVARLFAALLPLALLWIPASHRLFGLAAGGQIHPLRKHPGHEARGRA